MRTLLERVVRAAGRRPGWCCCGRDRRRDRGRARAAARAEHGAGDAGRQGLGLLPRDGGLPRPLRRPLIVVLVRGDLANLVLTDNLGRMLGLEGCLSGNKPPGQAAPGGTGSPCAEFARTKPVKVVYGPGTFINAAVGEINDQFKEEARNQGAGGRARQGGGAQARQGAGARQGGPGEGGERRRATRLRAVHARPADAQPALRARPEGAAADRRPRLRLGARVRPGARRDHAEGALRLPVPEPALGGHRGAPEPDLSEAQRRRAIELVRGAVAMKEWQLKDAEVMFTGRRWWSRTSRRRSPTRCCGCSSSRCS